MEKLVLGFPASKENIQKIETVAREYEVILAKQEELPQLLPEATLFCGHAKVPVDWPAIISAGNLKWIQSSAAGLDHCMHPAVVESDTLVSGASGLFANQVAETAMAILFGLVRSMKTFHDAQQKRIYSRKSTDDLSGKSLGIIGMGGNGQRIAQVMRPWVSQIVGTDFFPDQTIEGVDKIYPPSALVQVLNQSDVVIVTLPLTEDTQSVFGKYEFDAFRPGSYLINVGRGSVIDTQEMVRAIENGKFSGVGLDVVDPEPLPDDSPLWEMENVIITPHVGAQSARRLTDTTDFFCENIRRYRAGQTLLNLVDKKLGFPTPENRVPLDWRSEILG